MGWVEERERETKLMGPVAWLGWSDDDELPTGSRDVMRPERREKLMREEREKRENLISHARVLGF